MRRVGETERHHGIAGPAEAWSRCGLSVFLVRIMRVLSLCTFSVLHWFDNEDRARMQRKNLKTRYANRTLPYQTADASSHSTD
jgi:hypothetical protein